MTRTITREQAHQFLHFNGLLAHWREVVRQYDEQPDAVRQHMINELIDLQKGARAREAFK